MTHTLNKCAALIHWLFILLGHHQAFVDVVLFLPCIHSLIRHYYRYYRQNLKILHYAYEQSKYIISSLSLKLAFIAPLVKLLQHIISVLVRDRDAGVSRIQKSNIDVQLLVAKLQVHHLQFVGKCFL